MINEFDIINDMMLFCTKDLMLWKNIEGYILSDMQIAKKIYIYWDQ